MLLTTMRSARPKELFNKLTIFLVGSGVITLILLIRLFQLQVMAHDYYQAIATSSQYGFIEIPAQRGEVLIKDYHSDEEFALATNTTLNLIYADPTLVKDPIYIADKIGPLIFDIEDERAKDNERIKEMAKNMAPETSEEEMNKILASLSDPELEVKFRQDLIEKISEKKRKELLLVSEADDKMISDIKALTLPGIEIREKNIYAHPAEISNKEFVAEQLATIFETPAKDLAKTLEGKNRYVVLKRKLDPDVSEKITELVKKDRQQKDDNQLLTGIGMKEEYFRFYPEGTLASNVIGYTNHENIGQYGIESSFNAQLQGKSGKLQTKKDSIGRQITVGESNLEAAVDGDDVVLTIDRSIQLFVEKVLAEDTKAFQADSGQVLIVNPKTGAVLAMAHYPSFDPNNFGEVFKKVEISLTPEEIKGLYPTKDPDTYYFYVNEITLDRYLVFEKKDENGNTHYYRYENLVGPEVYHNKIVSWPYEPGSVFKPIVMASAIDDGDVTPNTTYNDSGPIGVDFNVYTQQHDFEIKNSTNQYWGLINMQTVLAKSLNTGMTFVAKKIGPALFYSYLKKFGFLDRTDIEFDSESVGKVEYFEDWTESELATHAFGQGLTITMIQLANAYSALANGGVLMQPYVVDEIRHDNENITKTEPQEIRRIISEDTAAKIKAMLIYTIDSGEGQRGSVEGHYIAGKTGTAQTYKHGKALFGKGTTIASFVGYAPIDDPQFVVIVKYDRPKTSEWGSSTAALTFSKIGEYLFDYYNIPPDKENSQ